jgi:hypothetical protein
VHSPEALQNMSTRLQLASGDTSHTAQYAPQGLPAHALAPPPELCPAPPSAPSPIFVIPPLQALAKKANAPNVNETKRFMDKSSE